MTINRMIDIAPTLLAILRSMRSVCRARRNMTMASVTPEVTVFAGGAWLLHEAKYNVTKLITKLENAMTAVHDAMRVRGLLHISLTRIRPKT